MVLQFRIPNIEDVESISRLMTQLGYPVTDKLMAERMQEYLSYTHNQVFLAVDGNMPIGLISFVINKYLHREGKFARITALVVDKNWRNKGIGKKLINYAEHIVTNLGVETIELTSSLTRVESGAHAFYKTQGYIDMRNEKSYFKKKLIS